MKAAALLILLAACASDPAAPASTASTVAVANNLTTQVQAVFWFGDYVDATSRMIPPSSSVCLQLAGPGAPRGSLTIYYGNGPSTPIYPVGPVGKFWTIGIFTAASGLPAVSESGTPAAPC